MTERLELAEKKRSTIKQQQRVKGSRSNRSVYDASPHNIHDSLLNSSWPCLGG